MCKVMHNRTKELSRNDEQCTFKILLLLAQHALESVVEHDVGPRQNAAARLHLPLDERVTEQTDGGLRRPDGSRLREESAQGQASAEHKEVSEYVSE